mmetsp:Transcript_68890/g.162115  ORF Transcript_68890/g.162115 Transcript_68890/m.162115 type:complete len:458 (-) Transcript_68890:32-1405(-)
MQAAETCLVDLVERLPEAQKPQARVALARFIEAFNLALPWVQFLRGCVRNFYVTAPDAAPPLGSVNIQGTPRGHGDEGSSSGATPEAPARPLTATDSVLFAIPSLPPDETKLDVVLDMPCLTSPAIASALADAHNALVRRIVALSRRSRLEEAKGEWKRDAEPANEEEEGEEEGEEGEVPPPPPAPEVAAEAEPADGEEEVAPVQDDEDAEDEAAFNALGTAEAAYSSNMTLLRRHLVQYRRDRDLPPLLFTFSQQGLDYHEGGQLEYDLQKLEHTLCSTILAGLRPLRLQLRQCVFVGDLNRQPGKLSELSRVVAQVALPRDLASEKLEKELDTADRTSRLRDLVELVITGALALANEVSALEPTTLVRHFAVATLGVDADEWAAASTPAVDASASLCHLSRLFLLLDDIVAAAGAGSSSLADVSAKFSTPLDTAEASDDNAVGVRRGNDGAVIVK